MLELITAIGEHMDEVRLRASVANHAADTRSRGHVQAHRAGGGGGARVVRAHHLDDYE